MDDFGVLVQSYGIKPQGKSSPMASSKPSSTTRNIDPSPLGTKPFSNNPISGTGSFFFDQSNHLFGFNSSNNPQSSSSFDAFDDVFPKNNSFQSGGGGGGADFDIESMFKSSMNLNTNTNTNSKSLSGNDDLIWGFSGNDDLLSSDPVDDFFGKLGKSGSDQRGSKVVNSDDLLPGFGISNAKIDRAQAGSREKSSGSSSLEELEEFVTGGTRNTSLNGISAMKGAKETSSSPLDELEDFVTGRMKNTSKGNLNGISATKGAKKTSSSSLDELEDFVTGGMKNTSEGNLNGISATKGAKKTSSSSLDELEDFVTGGMKYTSKGNLNGISATKGAKKKSSSSLDELEDFVTGVTKKTAKGDVNETYSKKEAKKTVSQTSREANFIDIEGSLNGDSTQNNSSKKVNDLLFPEEATDLNTFFGAQTKKSVPVTEDMFMNNQSNEVPDMFSGTPFTMEKKVPPTGFPDDFSSIFGGASTSAVFEEIEGESEERRRARYLRYQRGLARMAQALAEMNEREYQAQQEQEEKHRIADAMDLEMKRWAAGKEGNLRALLSSLQQVLAPELGWRPVTLTDLITSGQVKIAYKKAALCVHPDKVQQKGASLQQKFVAEKVFDLLKEAWNKFNTEELR